MSEASLAMVAAGAGGVTVWFLNFQPGHLGVHTMQLRHAVLLQVLTEIYVILGDLVHVVINSIIIFQSSWVGFGRADRNG